MESSMKGRYLVKNVLMLVITVAFVCALTLSGSGCKNEAKPTTKPTSSTTPSSKTP